MEYKISIEKHKDCFRAMLFQKDDANWFVADIAESEDMLEAALWVIKDEKYNNANIGVIHPETKEIIYPDELTVIELIECLYV